MKKVIALALAMAMALSMTAMAATIGDLTFSPAGTDCGDPVGSDGQMYPGNEYHFVLISLLVPTITLIIRIRIPLMRSLLILISGESLPIGMRVLRWSAL